MVYGVFVSKFTKYAIGATVGAGIVYLYERNSVSLNRDTQAKNIDNEKESQNKLKDNSLEFEYFISPREAESTKAWYEVFRTRD